ncbi:MAG: hypothetical protein LUQ59_12240 [Methanothrix sp.]|nr:hypothetical protein [Methanothrix sp.]
MISDEERAWLLDARRSIVKYELYRAAQDDDMPAQNGKLTLKEWDKLSKREQWELIKNTDLEEATKGMSDSERSSYIEKLQTISNVVDKGDGYRLLHYLTISGYIDRPNTP